jgi:NTP pyrophosphatase (non-canonical NTP hydrolase)|tara:strand:+ start:965 stop:1732 length:768 start_codon:yes stop_codon:yes gene_type:complete
MTYYIYHIPGKKIGVTCDLNNRVTVQQGYGPGEYEILETHTDIDAVSIRELQLQKAYGYKVDHRLYKTLNPKTKMKINVTEQTTTFPVPIDKLKGRLFDVIGMEWETDHGRFKLDSDTITWIMKNVKTSMYNPQRSYIYNKAFANNFVKEKKFNARSLKVFNDIRSWADARGIYENGDSKTQLIKLQEEVGELAKAILENDQTEIVDAIGDCTVVLTNLAKLSGYKIEDCIASAYSEISDRQGSMVNGTFVKDEN